MIKTYFKQMLAGPRSTPEEIMCKPVRREMQASPHPSVSWDAGSLSGEHLCWPTRWQSSRQQASLIFDTQRVSYPYVQVV